MKTGDSVGLESQLGVLSPSWFSVVFGPPDPAGSRCYQKNLAHLKHFVRGPRSWKSRIGTSTYSFRGAGSRRYLQIRLRAVRHSKGDDWCPAFRSLRADFAMLPYSWLAQEGMAARTRHKKGSGAARELACLVEIPFPPVPFVATSSSLSSGGTRTDSLCFMQAKNS